MNILKNIGAGLTGIVIGALLSIGTDYVLETGGILPHGNLWVSPGLIAFVLLYRCFYTVIGSFIAAKLAPSRPMRMATILGITGLVVSAIGAIATADMNLGPAWYAWTLAVLSLPSSLLGGWIYVRCQKYDWKNDKYRGSAAMRFIRIFLLVLIIVGVALLLSQKMWVPTVVDYILNK